MNGFSIADLRTAIVRSLRGRCLRVSGGLIARNGDRHEHCGTCQTRCGGEVLGFSGGVEVARAWGSDAVELRWPCPACGCEVTQETTALASLADADEVKRDPLCYACRKPANAGDKPPTSVGLIDQFGTADSEERHGHHSDHDASDTGR